MAVFSKTLFPKMWREDLGFIFSSYFPQRTLFSLKKKNRKESLTSVYTWLNLFIQTFRDFMNEKVILKKLSKLQKLGQG